LIEAALRHGKEEVTSMTACSVIAPETEPELHTAIALMSEDEHEQFAGLRTEVARARLEADVTRLRLEVARFEEQLRQLSRLWTAVDLRIAMCLANRDAGFPTKLAGELQSLLNTLRSMRPEDRADDVATDLISHLIADLRKLPAQPREAKTRSDKPAKKAVPRARKTTKPSARRKTAQRKTKVASRKKRR
jgi:hypothetical protein